MFARGRKVEVGSTTSVCVLWLTLPSRILPQSAQLQECGNLHAIVFSPTQLPRKSVPSRYRCVRASESLNPLNGSYRVPSLSVLDNPRVPFNAHRIIMVAWWFRNPGAFSQRGCRSHFCCLASSKVPPALPVSQFHSFAPALRMQCENSRVDSSIWSDKLFCAATLTPPRCGHRPAFVTWQKV